MIEFEVSPTSLSSQALVAGTLVATLLVIWLVGRLLVPVRFLPGNKMLRLAVVMVSGLSFTTGAAAFFCLRHMHFMSWLAMGQVLAVGIWFWLNRSFETKAGEAETWEWREIATMLAVGAVFVFFSILPGIWWSSEGGIVSLHEDLGFYVSLVSALPEAQAANAWAIFMGEEAREASGIRDAWYHWGGIFLAAGIRGVSGLPAAPALLLVTSGVLNFILTLAAAALADSLWRLRPTAALLAGAGAILCVHFVRLIPTLLDVLNSALPFDVFHHVRVTLALTLPYKYEGVLLLLTLALWQARRAGLSLFTLYAAACSAPHSVAVAASATATLAGLGLVLRDRAMLRTGLAATSVSLAGWATMHFVFSAGLTVSKGAPAVGFSALSELPKVLSHGLLDVAATMLMSVFFVAGAVFLVREGRRSAQNEVRLLGWLCISGIAGSCLALHALRSGDRFHVVMLTHAALVMPVGACGLLGMARLLDGWRRLAAIAILACVVTLGIHTQISPLLVRRSETWGTQDLAGLRTELQGRPFGYFSKNDRNWWISKHAMLGGLIESRCMRLNPLDERPSIHYSPHSSTLPLRWLPPIENELTTDWSVRLANRLGVRHVLETWEDRMPKRLREKCRPVWSGAGLMLYELPPVPSSQKEVVAR
jgi:hypothetical protein